MASIRLRHRGDGSPVWDVCFRTGEPPRQTSRRFDSPDEAAVFAATLPGNGVHGSSPRSASDLTRIILTSSTIDGRGCWVWNRSLTSEGYGVLSWRTPGRREFGAHRVSYSVLVGAIPDGLVIDHLCRNRACVNPDHLEPVEQRVNVMRSPIATGAINARKTHCPHGHAYTPENTLTVTNPGGRKSTVRVCRACTSNRNSTPAQRSAS